MIIIDKRECIVCGYVYDPEKGKPINDLGPSIEFKDIPDSWVCPVCGDNKDQFEKNI